MKLFIDNGEYTPTHCSECHEVAKVTVSFVIGSVYLCIKCIKKAESLFIKEQPHAK